jgi:hypothetical protein
MTPVANHYTVLADDVAVLQIVDEPGPLISTSAPPPLPGQEPPPHQFLTATALVATEEHRLRQILLESTSTDDYLERLRAGGYTVRTDQ